MNCGKGQRQLCHYALRVGLAAALWPGARFARADKTKADNGEALNNPASWTADTAVPGSTELAIFNSGLVNNHAFDLGDDEQSWGGIVAMGVPADISIVAGHTLMVGEAGIDATADAHALDLECGLILSASQTWNTAATLTVGGALNLGNFSLYIQGAGTSVLAGAIGGTGGEIVHAGNGVLTLSAGNSFTGGLEQMAGVTHFLTANSGGSGSVWLSGGTLSLDFSSGTVADAVAANGVAEIFQNSGSASSLNFSGLFSGAGTLDAGLTGTFVFDSTVGQFAGFSGMLEFGNSSGTARLGGINDHQLQNATVDLGSGGMTFSTRDGGLQEIGALLGGAGTVLRGATNASSLTTYSIGAAGNSTTFAGSILDGTGSASVTSLIKTGPATLTLSGTGSSYSGTLSIQQGVLATNNLAALGSGTSQIVLGSASSAGTFAYSGTSASTSRGIVIASTGTIDASGVSGSLMFSNTSAVGWGSALVPRTLVLAGSNQSLNTFALALPDYTTPGPTSLVKAGVGTWLVTAGASSFTGGTSVNGGLLLTNNNAGKTPLGTGPVMVNAGGTFGGTGVTSENVQVNGGGAISPGIPGAASGIGTMYADSLELGAGSVLDFDVSAASNDLVGILAGGSLSIGGGVEVNLYQAGTSVGFDSAGTYTLISNINFSTQFSGTVGSLYVGDPDPTANYAFSIVNTATDGTGNIVLSINPGAVASSAWVGVAVSPANSDWANAANWQSALPGGHAGDSAFFGAAGPGGEVSLNGVRRLGTLSLAPGSIGGYTLAAGTGGLLILDNGTAGAAQVLVGGGNQTLGVNTQLNSNTVMAFSGSGSTLTVSGTLADGVVSPVPTLSVNGTGRLVLLADNAMGGGTSIAPGAVVQLGNGSGTGSFGGAVAVNGELDIEHSGSAALSALAGAISGGGTLVQAGAGTLILDGSLIKFGGALSVASGKVILAQNSPETLKIDGLSIVSNTAGSYSAALDIAGDSLVIQTTGATGNKAQLLASIRAMVVQGQNGGSWTGEGITSAAVATDAATATMHAYHTTVAIADNGGYSVHLTSFGGVPVDANSILITRALVGDSNLDGTVNNTDLVALLTHFTESGQTQATGDYNGDGSVNNTDLVALLTDYTQTLPGGFGLAPGSGSGPATPSGAPEPGSLIALGAGAALLANRRRRSTNIRSDEKPARKVGGRNVYVAAVAAILALGARRGFAGTDTGNWSIETVDSSQNQTTLGQGTSVTVSSGEVAGGGTGTSSFGPAGSAFTESVIPQTAGLANYQLFGEALSDPLPTGGANVQNESLANSSWQDSWEISDPALNGQMGSLTLNFSVGGTLASYPTPNAQAYYSLTVDYQYVLGNGTLASGTALNQEVLALGNGGGISFSNPETVPFIFGKPFTISAALQVGTIVGQNPGGTIFNANSADFGAYFAGLSSIADQNGNPVSAASVSAFVVPKSGSASVFLPLTPAAPILWSGHNGNWSDASQWNDGGIAPGSTSPVLPDIEINGGTVVLNQNETIDNLMLNGGVLSGTGNLSLAGGTLTGAYEVMGTTTLTGGALTFAGEWHSTGGITGSGVLQVAAGSGLVSNGVTLSGMWIVNGMQFLNGGIGNAGTCFAQSLLIGRDSAGNFTGLLDIADDKLIVEAPVCDRRCGGFVAGDRLSAECRPFGIRGDFGRLDGKRADELCTGGGCGDGDGAFLSHDAGDRG